MNIFKFLRKVFQPQPMLHRHYKGHQVVTVHWRFTGINDCGNGLVEVFFEPLGHQKGTLSREQLTIIANQAILLVADRYKLTKRQKKRLKANPGQLKVIVWQVY